MDKLMTEIVEEQGIKLERNEKAPDWHFIIMLVALVVICMVAVVLTDFNFGVGP